MADMNSITISGRVGRDAELKALPSGEIIVTFSVANGVYAKGEGDYNTRTTWYSVSAFGKRYESLAQYITKGAYVMVTGEHSLRPYTGKDGEEKTSNDIRASNITLTPKSQQTDTQDTPAKPAPKAAALRKNAPQPIDDDSELPF